MSITIPELKKRLDNQQSKPLHLIDLRAKDAFEEGHIEGAINIPLDELEKRIDELDKNKEYHLICYSGIFSQQARNFLVHHGFKAINVESGMNAILNH